MQAKCKQCGQEFEPKDGRVKRCPDCKAAKPKPAGRKGRKPAEERGADIAGAQTCTRCGAVGEKKDFGSCPTCCRPVCIVCRREGRDAQCDECDPEGAEEAKLRPRGVWLK